MKRYRERCEVLETSYRETAEDYLRVAPIRSGAGIVADSVPENEFQECCNKARAVVQAIETAQEGLE